MMPAVSPDDVGDAPELLVLASLDATLMALRVAICAAFPELLCELGRQRDPPLLKAARQLADRACQLERAIGRYRRELQRHRASLAPNDDLPF
jgi:hypothetical protein